MSIHATQALDPERRSTCSIDRCLREIAHRTPTWSKNQPWAQDLDNINARCVQDLNEAFEACQDDLQSDEVLYMPLDMQSGVEHIPLDIWDRRLEGFFESLRTQTNKAIDESKAMAKASVAAMPVEVRAEAVNWFISGMNHVMQFWGFLRDAITQIAIAVKNSVRSRLQAILISIRTHLRTKAGAIVSQIHKVPRVKA